MTKPLYLRALAPARRLLMCGTSKLLGGHHAEWARAMQAEAAAIDDEREAFAFACGCLRAALGQALARAITGMAQPQAAGVSGCVAAVLLGCLFMHHAGAPAKYVWMNLLSLGFAVATFWLLPRRQLQQDGLMRARAAFAAGAVLLITSLGDPAAGAAAWLRIGPVTLNLMWLLLPALLVASDVGPQVGARRWALGGLLMAFGALALQQDALMAGLAAAFLALRACLSRSRLAALLALVPLCVAVQAAPRWQAADPAPFIDQVLQSGFGQHPATGLALVLALALALSPAWLHRRAREHGGIWGLLMALSLPGCVPSPLVGFGGSFIFGYLLSLALLPGGGNAGGTTGPGPASHRRRSRPPLRRSSLA